MYHFTCSDHGVPGIRRDGLIRPGADGLAWFTDLSEPSREAVGLTSHSLNCDRMEVRFTVDAAQVVRWGRVRRKFSPLWVDSLELLAGAQPAHWFVASSPVQVIA